MRWLLHLLSPLVFWFAFALFRSSILRGSKKKHDLVMRTFRFAADNGNRRALSVYGHLLHFRGDGVQNRIQGAIYLQRAADDGDVKACYQMGKVFEDGFEHYFQPNAEKALAYYRKAAEQGHHLAINRLIEACTEGQLGLKPDTAEAELWQARLPSLPERR